MGKEFDEAIKIKFWNWCDPQIQNSGGGWGSTENATIFWPNENNKNRTKGELDLHNVVCTIVEQIVI
jgi:hypothetical protein